MSYQQVLIVPQSLMGSAQICFFELASENLLKKDKQKRIRIIEQTAKQMQKAYGKEQVRGELIGVKHCLDLITDNVHYELTFAREEE